MNVKDFLSTSPEDLAKRQHNCLRDAAVQIIRDIVVLIKNGQYDKARQSLAYSPSGDGHGCDNEYIDFSSLLEDDGNGVDIGKVLGRLEELKDLSNNEY